MAHAIEKCVSIRPTLAEIDLDALVHNLATVRSVLRPGVGVCAMVKADAYGHGAVEVARALEWAGAEFMGVNLVEEGLTLREAGLKSRILVLGAWYAHAHADVVARDLTPVISDLADLAEFSRIAAPGRARVHLKFDTGMGRLGFPSAAVPSILRALGPLTNVEVEGVLSHLAGGREETEAQAKSFDAVARELAGGGVRPAFLHLANSEAIFSRSDLHHSLVRPGIALYGYAPWSDAPRDAAAALRPVMRVTTEIAHVKLVPTGARVSYGGQFVASRPTRVAVLPVGYADGFARALSERGGFVVIHGLRAPIVGAVCMDMMMVDVTDIAAAQVGDRVTLIGDGLSAADHARLLATIPYEIVTRVSVRVPRVIVRPGGGAP
ncbi:MAG: alanine racemase [Deltaproteobacteria bacterium]|nr:alanine racemase [Deltaproteobacteria bacterium]